MTHLRFDDMVVIYLYICTFLASQPIPALLSIFEQISIWHPYSGLSRSNFFKTLLLKNLETTDPK